MARYYRRRRYGYSQPRISAREELSRVAGGIDEDIKDIFLNLTSYKLEAVFTRYGKDHGSSALSYARKTYPKWKSREVQMSGKVAERLLNLVPSVLDSSAKYGLVKKLREAHRGRINKHVNCEPHEWRSKVAPELAELLASSSKFQLPQVALQRIQWLADGDSQSANQLLAAAEEEEAIARLQHIEFEFKRIDALIQSIDGKKTVSHTIDLPQGTIHVTIGKSSSGCFAMVACLAILLALILSFFRV